MEIDKMIELADGKKYALLLESELTEENYFLAVLLDDKEEPTNNYAVLEEVQKDGKIYVRKVSDPIILNQLLEDYQLQFDEEYDDEETIDETA